MSDALVSFDGYLEAARATLGAGNLDEAEDLFAKALAAAEREAGPHDLRVVPALTGIAAARIRRGAFDDAQVPVDRAIAVSEAGMGDVVILLNDLSRLYLKESAYAFAEPLLSRLLTIKRAKGDDHPEVATVLATLGTVYQATGRHEAAETARRRVLAIRERTLAPNHIAVATAHEHLADTCSARGNLREALQCFQRAHQIRAMTLSADDSSIRMLRERIADLQLQIEDLGEPLPAFDPSIRQLHPTEPLPSLTLVAEPPLRKTVSRPATHTPMAVATIPVPTASEVALGGMKPPSAQYLAALVDIQRELDADPEHTAVPSKPLVFFESMMSIIREHRIAASIAIGVLVLSPVAWGLSSGMRSRGSQRQLAMVEGFPRQQATPRLDSTVAFTKAVDAVKDTFVANTIKAAREAQAAEAKPVNLPTVPLARVNVARLDSATRAEGGVPRAPEQPDLKLSMGTGDGVARSFLSSNAIRAKLIGTPPVPVYPKSLDAFQVGGEVRVRFEVDTDGKPVMSTLQIVSSPHSALSESVKKVIPTMRFEPAHVGGPESPRSFDTVEIPFKFAPPPKS